MNQPKIDVLIIGGGPSGLSAAIELKKQGVEQVVVLEREQQAGGIPRHCGHPPFGFREFSRVYTGPQYAKKLVEEAYLSGVIIELSTTVVEVLKDGQLLISHDSGIELMSAKRVIYATGVRETPRSARLISGKRPVGVINTGALQSYVYLKKRRPFKYPAIIGSELVSFSAIQTCRHAGIQPVVMIEESSKPLARWPASLFARFARVPLYLNTRLVSIQGDKRVENIVIEDISGAQRSIDCDGVLLTGQFTPESTLGRSGHLVIDNKTGGPVVNQFGQCSDPAYFATGNLLRPVETAGWSWKEGRQIANCVVQDLNKKLPVKSNQNSVQLYSDSPNIKLFMPQILTLPHSKIGMKHIQLRFSHRAKGKLQVIDSRIDNAIDGERVIYEKQLSVYPERRVLISISDVLANANSKLLELRFEEEYKLST